jgi:2,3-bisphosphoglycerate-dependent phosphoglycerate mutase
MPNLILVRHGRTEYNMQKRFTGFTDVDVAELGKQDTAKVIEQIKASGVTPTVAYTSWLKRALQTLEMVQAGLGIDVPVTRHPFLNERHYGDLQGRAHEDMIAEFGEEQVQLWRRSYNVRPPNGECLADVVHRAQYYYKNEILPKLQSGETVLICAHGNTNRAFIKMLDNITDSDIVKREIAYDEALFYTV